MQLARNIQHCLVSSGPVVDILIKTLMIVIIVIIKVIIVILKMMMMTTMMNRLRIYNDTEEKSGK